MRAVITALKRFKSQATDAIRMRFWLFISCLKQIWNGHIPDDIHIIAVHSWYYGRPFKRKLASADMIAERTAEEFMYTASGFGHASKSAMVRHYENCEHCQTFSIRYFAKLQEESLLI
ncbi:hypothetical protein HYT45_04360 [Candidatus Uhrbacteria bacterium]|nr:hypothetical protein [Candidatus Uhrbacteria bacterium]